MGYPFVHYNDIVAIAQTRPDDSVFRKPENKYHRRRTVKLMLILLDSSSYISRHIFYPQLFRALAVILILLCDYSYFQFNAYCLKAFRIFTFRKKAV